MHRAPSGSPTFVLLKGDGTEITRNGRAAVGYGVDCFPWSAADMVRGQAEAAEKAAKAAAEAVEKESSIAEAMSAGSVTIFVETSRTSGTA